MRTLIVGGTRFVGRHIAAAALAAGHDVTLLHRGRSGADLFPEATHLLLDRNGDLDPLRGTRWDTVIDVSAYLPGQVVALGEALGDGVGRYVFISSTSVYAPPAAPGFDESSPVLTLPPGPVPDTVTDQTYGPLKVLCEQAARAYFGPDTLVVRPTYVVGPFDHGSRLTYWVTRLARGGEVLAPGYPDRATQLVDARDLAAFTFTPTGGTFHTAGRHMAFAALLETVAAEVAPAGTKLTWVDPQFLLDAGEDGRTIPLWYAGDEGEAAVNTADSAAAIAAGLRLRPLAESIHDVLGEPDRPGLLPPAREADLLAKWAGRPGSGG
jgi:2'-hydroxyisoflavone reductase